MPKTPLLTIAIPTYNSARFLPDSVESILRQGIDDFEIVIIDNASEDDTEDVIRSFESERIRYFRNTENLGARENHNRCLAEAEGEYFKFLCADDVLLDGVLIEQLHLLKAHPQVALVSCDISVTDSMLQGGKLHGFFPGVCSGKRVINACLSGVNNYIGGPSNFMFRSALARDLKLEPSYRFVSDLRFGLKLLERGAYASINRAGVLYRRHAASDTETNCPVDIRMGEYVRLIDEFDWWNPLSCAQVYRRGGEDERAVALGNMRVACQPRRVMKAIAAVTDVLHMRTRSLG